MTIWSRERGAPARRWRLDVRPDEVIVEAVGSTLYLTGEDAAKVQVQAGWFTARVDVAAPTPVQLRRLPKRDAPAVRAAVGRVLTRHRALPAVTATTTWHRGVVQMAAAAQRTGRWITQEARQDWAATRPGHEVTAALQAASAELPALFRDHELAAVRFLLRIDFDRWVDARNEEILAAETQRHRAFFDAVESRPLTDEQVRAVVSFDNRVQVVASAGSGKTSVMVARAAYAVLRGFVPPDRILLLAFNKAAAVELQERVERGLERAGLPTTGVKATTFHAFGLSVLGQATGRKPRAAAWLDAGQDVDMVCRIVDELRDSSPAFAYRWDLFRLLYARVGETVSGGEPDAWDRKERQQGFRTAAGEVVKSEGERLIADFLFFNGVPYDYEKPYHHDVADAEHSQYRPDFHYATPEGDLWHEHWALDAHGKPPAEFTDYAESMRWKKALHAQHRTALLETTWAQIMRPDGLDELAGQLRAHRLKLDWNPDRPATGSTPLKHEDLARLVRQFMSHLKSNSLTREDLEQRLVQRTPAGGQGRARLFLDLYWQIAEVWDAKLREDGSVDFEDMLVAAADHLEIGKVRNDWELVLVDEFQDASRARARLTRALVAPRGRHLLAVGDDWQSINRFAGADISVMTGFTETFGEGPSLRLQTTFRCTQELCDTASGFVSKNPRQLHKTVRSAQADRGPRVRLVVAASPELLPAELRTELQHLSRLAAQHKGTGDRKPATVDILGRYNFDRQLVPRGAVAGLTVGFRTVHSSKGLEADYVILPNVTSGTYGFPSTIQDDPVLALAMTEADDYPHAEERRLFYVALTRARRQVTLLTVRGRESPFVVELLKDGRVDVVRAAGPPPEPCPSCGNGTLVPRNGTYGPFLGCSGFPRCRHTAKLAAPSIGLTPGQGGWRDEPPF
jgi:DNA helicase-4